MLYFCTDNEAAGSDYDIHANICKYMINKKIYTDTY